MRPWPSARSALTSQPDAPSIPPAPNEITGPLTKAMRDKLKRAGWRSRYRLRKQVVEPVFGQIKQARGFRQFLLRGIEKVKAEWALICTAHNLTKLAGRMSRAALSKIASATALIGSARATWTGS